MTPQIAPQPGSEEPAVCFAQGGAKTLLDLVQQQARRFPHKTVYTFLADGGEATSLTFGELDQQARQLAATLQWHVQPGARVVLVYPPGLDFITALFGCIYAGCLAVPATYPKPRRPMPRLASIVEDSGAELALSSTAALATIDRQSAQGPLAALRWLATDVPADGPELAWRMPTIAADDVAYLQYTSGSTSEPKGVMVSHGNVLHNLEMIRSSIGPGGDGPSAWGRTSVSWLPAYHDMGLIGGVLSALYEGGHGVLMSPAAFLQRPLRWLQAISDYRGAVSGGPNFAYDLCVRKTTPEQRAGLDLSSWQSAFSSAEPVHADTLEQFTAAFAPHGFRESTFYPCYGLAEATLLAAGTPGPSTPVTLPVRRASLGQHRVELATDAGESGVQQLVACGGPLLGQELAIVDPQTCVPLPENEVGEIWLRGGSIGKGYWNRSEETERVFHAHTSGYAAKNYLRTGDLGFLSNGRLYVTGRLKDVVIIRGRNHYPQDIERTITEAHPALAAGAGAAFSLEVDGREVLAVAHEVDRRQSNPDFANIVRQIQRAIAEEHELDVHAIALVRQASLPRTTSGKMQRHLCRSTYLAGELKLLTHWRNEVPAASAGRRVGQRDLRLPAENRPLAPDEIDRLAERIESFLLDWMIARAGVQADQIDRDRPFAEYGLDSLAAVELSHDLEELLEIELTAVVAWNHPTPARLARYLARAAAGLADAAETAPQPSQPEDDFERLLAEVEASSEEEEQSALSSERAH